MQPQRHRGAEKCQRLFLCGSVSLWLHWIYRGVFSHCSAMRTHMEPPSGMSSSLKS